MISSLQHFGAHNLRASFATNLVSHAQAAELGRWGVARTIFEHGLRRHPKHAVMAEKLVEVLMQLGDWQAARPALGRMLAQDPAHPRAMQLSELVKAAGFSLAHSGTHINF